MTPRRFLFGVAAVAVAIILFMLLFHPEAKQPDRSSSPGPSATVEPSPSPSATSLPMPSPSPLPVFRTKPGVIVQEMLKSIVQNLLAKGSQNHLKAYYDAIRRLGPDALPALLEVLKGEDSPETKTAAINAMAGLRAMARNVPNLLKEGKSVEEIAKKLDMPEETIRKWIEAGAWKPEHTGSMVDGAWEVLHSSAPLDFRENSISTLYSLGDESPAATERLLEFIRATDEPGLQDRALGLAANRLGSGDPAPLARLATGDQGGEKFRMKAALAYLDATQDRADAADRARLQESFLPRAEATMNDRSAPADQRGLAIEVYGRLSGAAANPRLCDMLRSERDDATRCAVMKTLSKTQGLEGARAELEAIAAEPGGSTAKALAGRLLKVGMPRR